MPAYQGYRVQKPVLHRHSHHGPIRDKRFSQALNIHTNTTYKAKSDLYAHTHFSPTEPNRTSQQGEEALLHVEKRDSASLLVDYLNAAADDWECRDCSWKLRTLANTFNLGFHSAPSLEANVTPTSHPVALAPPDFHSNQRKSSCIMTPPYSTESSPRGSSSCSSFPSYLDHLRCHTRRRDSDANGQTYYGVHQAHFDLSLGGEVTVHMRPTDQKRRWHELKPGTIISAPSHRQYQKDIVSTVNHNTAVSGFGAVYSKYRKMIILETWAENAVCLPIYTYNGKGLERRRGIADEYMDIRDADDKYPPKSDTDHEPLMAVRSENWPGKNTFITGRSVVKLTEKNTHHFYDKCSIEGAVCKADFKRMYQVHLRLFQAKAVEVFGKPIDAMTIVPD
ncbi:hypothetical protein F53441_11956 [Fusarium austroafricanum]|uniref:DUF6590 domain-containing protein n=1 Tax=Fusarium austroafricanum TaxID=2364996 RepID=A0A8H4K1H8_9HYPO|nr:hypothetical protein F53441_11956 [Fusarium austroafricanum]